MGGSTTVGLVTNFHASKNFTAATGPRDVLDKLGYWKFDGQDIDTEGTFEPLALDEPEKSEEIAKLKKIWEEQKKQAQERHTENVAKVQAALSDESDEFDGINSPRSPDSKPEPSQSQSEPGSGVHAMVLLGTYTDPSNTVTYFVLLNWWWDMPLVVVSAEYLRACGAIIYFPKIDITKNPQPDEMPRRDGVVGECAFMDGGEEEHDGLHYNFEGGPD